MRDRKTGLTTKQLSFADKFIICGNATEAYKQSQYSQKMSDNSKRICAYKLLQNPLILDYIEAKLAEKAKKDQIKADITRDELIQELRSGLQLAKDKGSLSNIARFCELLGRAGAHFTDNVNTNDIQRQRELDAMEAAEADKLANIRLDQIEQQRLPTAQMPIVNQQPLIPAENVIVSPVD